MALKAASKPRRAATTSYHKRVQLYLGTSAALVTLGADDKLKDLDDGTGTTDAAAPASGYQYEIYALHVYVDAAEVFEITDGTNILWSTTFAAAGESSWYFPLVSPLQIGDAAIPYVQGANATDALIRAYGAIRAVV